MDTRRSPPPLATRTSVGSTRGFPMIARHSAFLRFGLGFIAAGTALGGGLVACGSGDDSSSSIPDAGTMDSAKADSSVDSGAPDSTTDSPADSTTSDAADDGSDAADSGDAGDAAPADGGVLSKINHFV